jgi:hypothetical protein
VSSAVENVSAAYSGTTAAPHEYFGQTPDDTRASKAAVAIVNAEGADPSALQGWFAEEGDVREDPAIASEILQFVRDHAAKSVVTTDRIIGCPHEEGIDYPEGQVGPQCPFWAHRDRWSGQVVQ